MVWSMDTCLRRYLRSDWSGYRKPSSASNPILRRHLRRQVSRDGQSDQDREMVWSMDTCHPIKTLRVHDRRAPVSNLDKPSPMPDQT
jgi:hypothetical protein